MTHSHANRKRVMGSAWFPQIDARNQTTDATFAGLKGRQRTQRGFGLKRIAAIVAALYERRWLAVLRRKLQGYWNYYGVRGNSQMLGKYQCEVHRLLYKWLNRRSQSRSMTWRLYCERWKTWKMPASRLVETFPSQALRRPPKLA